MMHVAGAWCWRDSRRKCLHDPERSIKCLREGLYCDDARKWPNVLKQIERLEEWRQKQ